MLTLKSAQCACIIDYWTTQQKSKCSNHRAINATNTNRTNLEATGLGACACARHGCFIPTSAVDFQRGEQ